MNEENEWDQNADADTAEGAIERVMREDITEAFKHMKIGKAPGPSDVYAELILASRDVDYTQIIDTCRVLMELCQRILDGKGMPEDLATSVANVIFKGKGYIMNCSM